jgi:pilus assembly protein Flp/PilA
MADAESTAGEIVVFFLSIYLCLKILVQSAITLLNPRRIRLRTVLSNLIRDESGVTAIEYALIAALIAVAAIAAFTLVGTNLSNTFSTVAAKL